MKSQYQLKMNRNLIGGTMCVCIMHNTTLHCLMFRNQLTKRCFRYIAFLKKATRYGAVGIDTTPIYNSETFMDSVQLTIHTYGRYMPIITCMLVEVWVN